MKCIIPIIDNGVTVRHECHASNQSVKLTKENIMIKNRDTWTMEITFPLSMSENMEVFGHINRIDVTRRKAQFKDCTLYAGNTRIITGTGTVTYVSDTEARLQILAGKEDYRYKEGFEQSYIDRLNYVMPAAYSYFPMSNNTQGYIRSEFESKYEELLPYCTFTTIYAGSIVCNWPWFYENGTRISLHNPSVQPNLWFVVRTCLESLGYELKLRWYEYDIPSGNAQLIQSRAYELFPNVYMCNVRKPTVKFAMALPHWTVERFLHEVEQLFNVTFVFSEDSHTAFMMDNASLSSEEVAVECVDEFSAEYDDEGIKLIGASNLAYNLSDAHPAGIDISEDILALFNAREFDSKQAAINDWTATQTDEETLMTTIWKFPEGYFYSDFVVGDNNEKTFFYKDAGQLQHLTRTQGNADDTVTLNIAPVAMGFVRFKAMKGLVGNLSTGWYENGINLPCMDEPVDEDDDSPAYYSVKMAIDDEAQKDDEVAERLEVFTLGDNVEYNFHDDTSDGWVCKLNIRFPQTFADSGWYDSLFPVNSLALDRDRVSNTIGSLHGTARSIEGQIRHTIRFLYHGMPDPKKVYIIRGKRFLCEKIEVEIKDDMIQDLKTGYFFEML